LLREFLQHSRRHRHHQHLAVSRRQKANRYFMLSILSLFLAIPFLLQNFIENFLEENWKWLLVVISISAIVWTYKLIANNRKNKMESFALSVPMQESSENNSVY
jgi:4-hydroxybenzoate polyprenyltransferase